MLCRSTYCENVDPYEAGAVIGEALNPINPEVVLIFPSVHYHDFRDLLDGVCDCLNNKDVIIVGGTGDGFYETRKVGSYGVSAMGINSRGSIKWLPEFEKDISQTPYAQAKKCAQRVASGRDIQMAIVFGDGITSDGEQITAGVMEGLGAPFFGGLTGDDRKFEKSFVFANGEILSNGLVILGMGGDFSFAINAASGWRPVGKIAYIDESRGNQIARIGGMTAVDFMQKNLGHLPNNMIISLFPLAIYDKNRNFFLLRTSLGWDMETGIITVFGGVKPGSLVRICQATIDDILKGVEINLDGLEKLDFEVKAAIGISCAARKWILRDMVDRERQMTVSRIGNDIPFVGYSSYGEISPFRKPDGAYTDTFFHNETYTLLLLGAGK